MLIQRARPRFKPPGNVVYRLNRSHRLAAEARAVMSFGPPFGIGRELVTGTPMVVTAGTSTVGITQDGPAFHAPTLVDEVATSISSSLWQIGAEVTVACRVFPTSASGTSIIQDNGSPINGNYYELGWGEAAGSLQFNRAAPGNNWRWTRSATGLVVVNQMQTHSVSGGATMAADPAYYVNGVFDTTTPVNVWVNGTTSQPAGGSANPIRIGRRQGNSDKAATGYWPIGIVAARQWSADEHLLFHLDPYGVLEEAPRWYFRGLVIAGATYNDTITDAATGADTSASALTTAGSTTDAATAADTSASAHVAAASVTDLATVGEAVASALVAPAALSDTATAADVLATTLATSPVISDAATAADSTTGTVAAVTYDEAISDEAAAAEIVAAALAMPASVADAATGADALAALLATSAILVDAATLAEALATTLATSPILTDSVAAGDSVFTSGQAVAVPASRTYRLPTAPRRHALAAESRTYRLRAAPRRYTVPPEA